MVGVSRPFGKPRGQPRPATLKIVMNIQGTKNNPGSGICWTHIFGPGSGRTANPVKGCEHQCEWRMPGGEIARCYAKEVALRFPGKHYKQGFEHISWHPDELIEIQKEQARCGIFIDSMSDLFGRGVDEDWIREVLATMVKCPHHVFQSLTKNPTKLMKFSPFPENLWVGVSLPPTFMFGHEMTRTQQEIWFAKALKCLSEVKASVRWVSLEPLSWDCSEIIREHGGFLDWAVIGAASSGYKKYQPDLEVFKRVAESLAGKPIWLKKSNVDPALANQVFGQWRSEFPKFGSELSDGTDMEVAPHPVGDLGTAKSDAPTTRYQVRNPALPTNL